MISRQLAHQAINKLQVILGRVSLLECEERKAVRELHISKAKIEIKDLAELLRKHSSK